MRRLALPVLAALSSLALVVVLGSEAGADRLPEHAREVVDYAINVRLDAAAKQLYGQQRLTWRNPSEDPVSELWFHLYLNAFKNTRSTFFRESGGQLRGDRAAADKWGWIDVTSMKLPDGTDLLPGLGFEHPDDDNAEDQTVARVRLPEPVPPGGSITLEIGFKAQLPQVFARTGFRRNYFLVGQWFPKLGVYEPAGTRGRQTGGWNCHQFHAHSEFYADYGHFKVEITVPARFVVGATGQRQERRENKDGTATHVFEQGDVHDFAWTTAPDFVEVKRTFSAGKDVTAKEYEEVARLLGRSLQEVQLKDVDITVLVQPRHLPQAQRYVESAVLALKYFGLWYGAYPYPTLTVVDPAPGAGGSGGMEYPTFITAGTSFLLQHRPFDKIRAPEFVTVHEFGHQFWYGLVGNNEFEEAWLDEGINSYSTGKIMAIGYGKEIVSLLGLRLGEEESARMQNHPERRFGKIRTRSWGYLTSNDYGFNSYFRPQLVLRTLEGFLGEETMARVMRTFHERWRFRHPASDDFYAVVNEVSGQDLKWYFDQVVEESGVLDYEVSGISSRKLPEPVGVFDRGGRPEMVDSKEAKKREKEADKKGSRQYESRVELRRLGEVAFPVEVELRFEGKPPERRVWDGKDRWVRWDFVRPEKLVSAHIDPDKKVLLDVSWLNNSKRVKPEVVSLEAVEHHRAAAGWAARYYFWVQQALALLGL